jgi:cellulose synthase/poly-beta-1,6-N-acetylglucosamine synthase-like glycosyltransferase
LREILFLIAAMFVLVRVTHVIFALVYLKTKKNDKSSTMSLRDPLPRVNIVVPCLNEEKVVAACLQSLLAIDYANFFVTVIDDGSTDQTYAIARKFADQDSRVHILQQPKEGKYAALNAGICHAASGFVFCMDADSIVEKDVLKKAVSFIQANPQYHAIAADVLVTNHRNILTEFQFIEYLVRSNWMRYAQSLFSFVTTIPGPGAFYNTQKLIDVGLFNGLTCIEDSEMTVRFVEMKLPIVVCPGLRVSTEVPQTISELIKQRYRWDRGSLQILRTHFKEMNFSNSKIWMYFAHTVVSRVLCFAAFLFIFSYPLLTGDFEGFFLCHLVIGLSYLPAATFQLAKEKSLAVLPLALVSQVFFDTLLLPIYFLAFLDEALRSKNEAWIKLARYGRHRVEESTR